MSGTVFYSTIKVHFRAVVLRLAHATKTSFSTVLGQCLLQSKSSHILIHILPPSLTWSIDLYPSHFTIPTSHPSPSVPRDQTVTTISDYHLRTSTHCVLEGGAPWPLIPKRNKEGRVPKGAPMGRRAFEGLPKGRLREHQKGAERASNTMWDGPLSKILDLHPPPHLGREWWLGRKMGLGLKMYLFFKKPARHCFNTCQRLFPQREKEAETKLQLSAQCIIGTIIQHHYPLKPETGHQPYSVGYPCLNP